MFQDSGLERFVVIWNAEGFMGWIICRQQNIEETVESALANVTNIADTRNVRPWRRFPKRMSVSRKPNCKLIAKNIVVGHCNGVDVRAIDSLIRF